MRKKFLQNSMIFLVLIILLLLTMQLQNIPWWSFLIPVWIAGVITRWFQWKVATLWIGFLAGFTVWMGGLAFFHWSFNGILLKKTGPGLFVIPIMAGLTGGVLTALAFYSGKILLRDKKVVAPKQTAS